MGRVRLVVRAVLKRRNRWLLGEASRCNAIWGIPRSAGRQSFGVGCDVYWALPVLIIAAREVAISMYRVLVGAKGISVPASQLAKWKTLFQQLSVGFAIIPLTADKATWIWLWLLWIAVAFTTVSGLQYLWRAQKLRKTTPNLMA